THGRIGATACRGQSKERQNCDQPRLHTVLARGGSERNHPRAHYLPDRTKWLKGRLKRKCENRPDATSQIDRKVRSLPPRQGANCAGHTLTATRPRSANVTPAVE